MKFFIDLTASNFRNSLRSDATSLDTNRTPYIFPLRDTAPIEIHLLNGTSGPVDLAAGSTMTIMGKIKSTYPEAASESLFTANNFAKVGNHYTAELDLNTTEFITAMGEAATRPLVIEVEIIDSGGKAKTIMQADASGASDVIRGDEGTPVDAGPVLATTTWTGNNFFAQSGTITEATPTNDEYEIDFDSGAIYTRLTVSDDVDLTTTGREAGIVKRQYIEIINTDTNDHQLTTEAWLWLGGPPLLIPGPGSLFIEIFSTGAAVGDIRAAAAIGE
jgi:hypothetical protein